MAGDNDEGTSFMAYGGGPPTDLYTAISGVTEVRHTDIHADPDDPTDTADANAFEAMNRDQTFSPASVTPEPNGPQSPVLPPDDTDESRMCNAEASSTIFIDHFPHGHPGASLSGAQVSAFESIQNALGDSIWAPFQSQCDWEVARWAKMRGPTSTALTELLAIPGVRERPQIPPLRC